MRRGLGPSRPARRTGSSARAGRSTRRGCRRASGRAGPGVHGHSGTQDPASTHHDVQAATGRIRRSQQDHDGVARSSSPARGRRPSEAAGPGPGSRRFSRRRSQVAANELAARARATLEQAPRRGWSGRPRIRHAERRGRCCMPPACIWSPRGRAPAAPARRSRPLRIRPRRAARDAVADARLRHDQPGSRPSDRRRRACAGAG